MEQQPFEWTCKRNNCKRFIMAWTEKGLQLEIDRHLDQHRRDDIQAGNHSVALTVYKRSNYETLLVNATDAGFLRTRGIKLDDSIIIDETLGYQVSDTELSLSRWAKILDAAWEESEEEDAGTKRTK